MTTGVHEKNFLELLRELTVDCKDDQTAFTVADRVAVIRRMLASSAYELIHEGSLSLIYARKETERSKPYVLISSHIDCVYEQLFVAETETDFTGTFDNSLTNACLVDLMLRDALPEGVVVAFTGAEEQGSFEGASEVVQLLQVDQEHCRLALVLDVTNEGAAQGMSFTLENDQGIDLFSAHRLIERFKHVRERFVFVHEALPDETWAYYPQFYLPSLSLCIPVTGDMHADSGVSVRKTAIPDYQAALQTVVDVCLRQK